MISADLGAPLEKFVADLVREGRYNSKSEVLREGVRMIQDREARLALNHAIETAEKEFDQGQVTPANQVFDRLEAKYRATADDPS
ncbi:type II toxin-antitoxin system ParD family antitoxin [Citromicrobium bathyomarinum]|uniref:type II toxin-antitoxin system ParD family antitoxin n=1 Tax=unclassified Citromicrobium TaxID=2630544 RepID=UPI0006C92382|nr:MULTISPECIES: type II toxin-antitoxin system ParD family antitoxin [unclassified Citromicrobium]KPM25232.1 addiction module antitoxin [Citromicrobium sp. RCC1885]KPM28473.1 addiction module antitoxin [Citromicrobium sp. RCC1878]MAO05007.1 type II toxin-antitoxin system ParD family antitoxin [Citromicrobium sp.]OAM09988.1 addiction module antitoxin [Citromicrobium sp. RCC1897]|tara:strand:+ start:677 stop:931 length:255 start_codon:yes stop_codon:yes gene_type:complete